MGKDSTTAIDEDKETDCGGDGCIARGLRRSGQRRRRNGEEAAVLHAGEVVAEKAGEGEGWGPRGGGREVAIGKISRDCCEVDIG